MISISIDSKDYLLFWYPHNFSSKQLSAVLSIDATVASGKASKEERKTLTSQARIQSYTTTVSLQYPLNQQLKESLLAWEGEKILVPFWPAKLVDTDYTSSRTIGGLTLSFHEKAGKIDIEQPYEVHTGTSHGLSGEVFSVPLLVSVMPEKVNPSLITDSVSEMSITFEESGELNHRVSFPLKSFDNGPQLLDNNTPKILPFDHDFSKDASSGGAFSYSEVNYAGRGYNKVVQHFGGKANRYLSFEGLFTSQEYLDTVSSFFNLMGGSSEGFWVPAYLSEGGVNQISDTGDTIVHLDHQGTLTSHPWVSISGPKGTHYSRVSASAVGQMTLQDALPFPVLPKNSLVTSLIYARFEKSLIKLTWATEKVGKVSFEAYELSEEYSPDAGDVKGVDIGNLGREASVYEITSQGETNYYTSYDKQITFQAEQVIPKNMSHGDVTTDIQLNHTCTLEVVTSECPEVEDLFQFKTPEIDIKIHKCQVSGSNAVLKKTVFVGTSIDSSQEGNQQLVDFKFLGNRMEEILPKAQYRKTCWHDFGQGGCHAGGSGLDLADWTFSAQFTDVGTPSWPYTFTIGSMSRDNAQALPPMPAKFFTDGMAWVGDGKSGRSVTIVASTALSAGSMTITLSGDFSDFPSNGDSLKLQPSCNGTRVQCSRYGNLPYHGGCKRAAGNLSLIKVSDTVGGGKK